MSEKLHPEIIGQRRAELLVQADIAKHPNVSLEAKQNAEQRLIAINSILAEQAALYGGEEGLNQAVEAWHEQTRAAASEMARNHEGPWARRG